MRYIDGLVHFFEPSKWTSAMGADLRNLAIGATASVLIRVPGQPTRAYQWSVRREFSRRLRQRLDAIGIESPYDRLESYARIARDNTAPLCVRQGHSPSESLTDRGHLAEGQFW
jgi:hypothetical protein